MIWIFLIVGAVLLFMSILDFKHKQVPSFISTALIILLSIWNIALYPYNITFGILGFVFAWFLYEFDFFRGMADIKAVVIISLMLTSLNEFYAMMILIPMLGVIYQFAAIKLMKEDIEDVSEFLKIKEEVPFVPLFFLVYVAMMVITYGI